MKHPEAPSDDEQFGKLPPQDIEAERCALASAMLDAEIFTEMRGSLSAGDFFEADNEIIWTHACKLVDAGGKLDPITLRAQLLSAALWEEIGGKEYLKCILDSVPSPANGMHYAAIVKDKAVLRGIIGSCVTAWNRCYAPARERIGADLALELAAKITELACGARVGGPVHISEPITAIMNRSPETVRRIKTGLTDLDAMIGGIGIGQVTMIGAKGGMGKSTLGKQLVLNMARIGIACGIISIEENREKVAENLLSNASNIENNHIAFGTIHAEEWEAVQAGANEICGLPIWIEDAAFSVNDITAAANRLVMKHKCQVLMVDHIHLIDAPDNAGTRNEEISTISAAMKKLFRRLNVAGLEMAQLNRAGGAGERPALSNLRDSGTLEADSDVVVLLHRQDYYRYREENYIADHIMEAIVAKNKSGPVGVVPLNFEGKYQRITDASIEQTYKDVP